MIGIAQNASCKRRVQQGGWDSSVSIPVEATCAPTNQTSLPFKEHTTTPIAQLYMDQDVPPNLPMAGNLAELMLPGVDPYPMLRPEHVYEFDADAFRREISTGTWLQARIHQDLNFG
jgi:hypothetical protein